MDRCRPTGKLRWDEWQCGGWGVGGIGPERGKQWPRVPRQGKGQTGEPTDTIPWQFLVPPHERFPLHLTFELSSWCALLVSSGVCRLSAQMGPGQQPEERLVG